ncbi:MAG: cytidyltransferase [Burkholderiales bacterium 66-5]|uniref:bifunctional nicotinamide-nucleotide adenylyltransferase/Nudix hydroxylase n=1 Tax=Comamonas badia TaxID=265291 RepID=UPI000465E035|nr:bifunctional nicotinamide-nucleotide adenylyltransferase/Nudix hydroxylase [Comamonas badia]OJU90428.1 MAG: cytidyltransferase [Burkholderiales bacterium 66-5]
MHDVAVLIGRFQPPHNGHLALLQEAFRSARMVIVVVGSAFQARSPKNPFTWQERADLLRASVDASLAERLTVLPVRDYYDEPRWARAVRTAVASISGDRDTVALVGHFKDTSSGYLAAFPGWSRIDMPRIGRMDSTLLRDAWFGAAGPSIDAALAPFIPEAPAATLAWLKAFAQTPAHGALAQEWQMLRDYRAAWASAPWPPVFVTVDALLQCQGRVLLIERGHAPGKGLWALPGGFLEPHDTLWQSCLRELREETQCGATEAQLRAALRQVRVFDHPGRSQRGRTITHVHHFDLGNAPLPPVRGGDDAASAQWRPISDLPAMEADFFEDHFHILDRCLGLLPDGAGA